MSALGAEACLTIEAPPDHRLKEQLSEDAALLAASPYASRYADRLFSPSDTVARMGGWFKQLGITRVASVTALDRIGIPVYLATRPNSCTLAVTQGKGIDDDSARASAIMEAAEQAIAERPRVSVVTNLHT